MGKNIFGLDVSIVRVIFSGSEHFLHDRASKICRFCSDFHFLCNRMFVLVLEHVHDCRKQVNTKHAMSPMCAGTGQLPYCQLLTFRGEITSVGGISACSSSSSTDLGHAILRLVLIANSY